MSAPDSPTAAPDHLAAAQRRTLVTLVVAQAVGAMGITIGIATASLLARDLSGSEQQAGLAQTCQVLGAAVASYLLARLMSRRGRRVGLVLGYALGAGGAVLAVLSGVVGSMALLLVGAILLGATTAANSGSRYAATDLALAQHRARSLSTVVWASTIGAVAGPNLTGPAGAFARQLGIPELTGPFALGSIGMVGAAVVIAVFLRPDPLLLAREAAGVSAAAPSGTSWSRVVGAVRERPVLAYAVAGLAAAHAVMVSVMVMTPLHMEHGGAELRVIGIVISVHVLGMFAFSPLVGMAADRQGRAVTLAVGAVLLAVSLVLCAQSPEGSSWQIFSGLFLLGLGWSFATVSASTLIADHAPLDVRADVQGAADLVMGVTAAAAGGLAGVVVGTWGYATLAWLSAALVSAVVVSAAGSRRLAE
ncbi:MFS transporter [Nocardioides sp. MAHUQ-72]|uniref:MFS transporter n=1 Tax=unclassified Nocardioides TaxID=2615069 RepID=UPI0036062F64